MAKLIDYLNVINKCCNVQTLSVGKLTPHVQYRVERLEKMTSKYGSSTIAYVSQGNDILWRVYLPRRFNTTFTNDIVNNFNKRKMNDLFMTFKGVTANVFNVEFN